MATSQESLNQAQLLYVAYYGRPADPAGQAYWADRIEADGVGQVLNAFGTSAEYDDMFGELSNPQLVNNLYEQLFSRSPEPAGLNYYTDLLNSGEKTLAEIAYDIASGAQGDDKAALDNKLAVADEFTGSLNTTEAILAYQGNAASEAGRDFLADVNQNTDVADVDVDGFISSLVNGEPEGGSDFRLTTEEDNLTGTAGDDVFDARLGANAGVEGDTLNTSDVLDGGAGTDVLNAQLIPTGTVSDGALIFNGSNENVPVIMTGPGVAVAPKTDNIEVVNVQVQARNTDAFVNGSAIDAGEMNGVQQWWSDNSRDFLQIEDIRSETDETTFGMRETDPNVSYTAYFAATQLDAQAQSVNAALRITIRDENTAGDSAFGSDVEVREISFTLGGEEVIVDRDALGNPRNIEELVAALNADFEAKGLGIEAIDLERDGSLIIEDKQGREFEKGQSLVSDGEGVIFREQQIVDPSEYTPLISTNVVLDQAGNGSQGGVLNIGGMSGDQGIGQFDVEVGRDSHLLSMSSINLNAGSQPEGYLEVVNIANLADATGDLTLGMLRGTGGLTGGELTSVDDRAYGFAGAGLTDVRVVDASEFDGELNAAINLTQRSGQRIDSYFRDKGQYGDDGADAVPFKYIAGNNDDTFTFDLGSSFVRSTSVENQEEWDCCSPFDVAVADPDNVYLDADFDMFVEGGAGNDRFNFNNTLTNVVVGNTAPGARESINIDGGEGYDTVEVTTSSTEAWESFENVEQLVVAGSNDTQHNLVATGMTGLEDVRISTTLDYQYGPNGDWSPVLNTDGDVWEYGVRTTVRQIEEQTDVTISGENQTLSETRFDNDVDQVFDCIELVGVAGIEDIQVTLDNTARGSANSKAAGEIADNFADTDFNNFRPAELSVQKLDVTNASDDLKVATLVSNGNRQAFNTVQDMTTSAGEIQLEGTQSLNLNVTDMGNLGGANGPQIIDASDLTNGLASNGGTDDATLTLALAAKVTNGTSGNTTSNSRLEVTGTESDGDVLQLYGDFSTSMRVREFETVQFGNPAPLNSETPFLHDCVDASGTPATGEYNASNDEGVELYDIANIGTEFTLSSLADGDTVRIRDFDGSDKLNLLGELNTSSLNIELDGAGTSGSTYTFSDLTIGNAGDVTISTNDSNKYIINNLDLDDTVNNLNVSGNVTIDAGVVSDSLSVVDLSGIVNDGESVGTAVTMTLVDGGANATNTTFLLGAGGVDDATAEDGTITIDAGVTTDTTFDLVAVSQDADDITKWVIEGFGVDPTPGTGGDTTGLDFIDLSDIVVNGGAYSFGDLSITDDGTDTVITSAVIGDQNNWEIQLSGVLAANITADNFV